MYLFFFFSSRRRHTRCSRDWSSDVCSSDLQDITKSSVEVTIDVNTVDTREPDRDKDLRSERFFDVAHFPTMTFKSKKVEQLAPGKLRVTGDLTIRGTSRDRKSTRLNSSHGY